MASAPGIPRAPSPFDWEARSHPEVCERLLAREEQLSKFAAKARNSRGRQRPDVEDPMRTAFQRDRDRIIHSKAFRRLKHKTQVFIAPLGDHYRTRLTHTMEVMQVARSIARGLNLNEDLAEATALGHDLGHTPFGHAGETALGELLPWGFRHNEQSVRVVEVLEKGGEGLNLTQEVRDGILKHSKLRDSIAAEGWGIANTLEGQIVKIADSLAYLNHDIDDAIRAGIISIADLPRHANEAFGTTSGSRITAFVTDVVDYNWRVATNEGSTWQEAIGNGTAVGMSPAVLAVVDELREFMFSRVYTDSAAKEDDPKTHFVMRCLYEHFTSHPEEMPDEWARNPRQEPIERRVADYIAGMTDRYAVQAFESIYVPKQWIALGGR
ncbi:MAG: deoxyguanosinetriphosphate triphosphohydrolase [Chloroflexi bacterium]|nr:deoxyguanosinetriphosphate triphosphohydrolase [Chloroflexota bacterium]